MEVSSKVRKALGPSAFAGDVIVSGRGIPLIGCVGGSAGMFVVRYLSKSIERWIMSFTAVIGATLAWNPREAVIAATVSSDGFTRGNATDPCASAHGRA